LQSARITEEEEVALDGKEDVDASSSDTKGNAVEKETYVQKEKYTKEQKTRDDARKCDSEDCDDKPACSMLVSKMGLPPQFPCKDCYER
jgi:hypothetical protein